LFDGDPFFTLFFTCNVYKLASAFLYIYFSLVPSAKDW